MQADRRAVPKTQNTSGTNFSLLFFGEHPLHKIRTFTAFHAIALKRYLDPQRGALDEACGGARAARRAGLDETQEERARQHMQQSATDKSGSSGAPHEFFWPKMPR
ncbi:hypothetical protein [Adlercreutzia sp.]|jgi:hypothetical protein|uniref:hypothetical protein n=1 Tax=Adlercreutzia sp. TaxID=1872387 RepID=UPI003AB2947C